VPHESDDHSEPHCAASPTAASYLNPAIQSAMEAVLLGAIAQFQNTQNQFLRDGRSLQ
jgi:hypothetical protein